MCQSSAPNLVGNVSLPKYCEQNVEGRPQCGDQKKGSKAIGEKGWTCVVAATLQGGGHRHVCFIADLIFFFFVPAQRAPTLSAYGACDKARDSFSIVPMEFAMAGHDIREQHYPMVEFVLDAIAGWINKYRHVHGVRDELGECSQEDVMRIAKDLGVGVSDLRGLAAKGPGKCCSRFLSIRRPWQRPIPPSCETFNAFVSFVARKAVVSMNWLKVPQPRIFVSSVPTPTRSRHCLSRKNSRPRIDAALARREA
jgi:hypothetical protein